MALFIIRTLDYGRFLTNQLHSSKLIVPAILTRGRLTDYIIVENTVAIVELQENLQSRPCLSILPINFYEYDNGR